MPATSGAIKAGRAFVQLFADDSQLRRTLSSLGRRMQQFGKALVGIGTSVTASLAGAVATFAKTGDELDKMSKRTGVAVESLSTLKFAAEQSGSSLEDLGTGIRGMDRFILNAERGLSSATETLDALGLSVADLTKLSPEQRFLEFAEAIAAVADPSRRAALAMQVFGRSGEKMVPLLAQGKDGIRKLREEAKAAGLELSGEDAKAAAAFTDALNKLTQSLKGIVFQIGSAVAPALTEFLNRIQPTITATIGWVKENKDLVVVIGKVAAILTGAGFALIVTGKLAASITAIAVAAKGAGAAFGTMATGAATLNLSMKSLALTLGRVAALLVLIDTFQEMTTGGSRAGQGRIKVPGGTAGNRRLQEFLRGVGPAEMPAGQQPAGGAVPGNEMEKQERAADDAMRKAGEALANLTGKRAAESAVKGAAAELGNKVRDVAMNFQQVTRTFQRTPLGQFQVGTLSGRDLIREALTGRGREAQTVATEVQRTNQLLQDIKKQVDQAPTITLGGQPQR